MSVQENSLVPAKTPVSAAALTPATATDVSVASNQILEINAVDAAVYVNFTTDASATEFHAYVLSGTVRHYAGIANSSTFSVKSTGTVVAIVY